MNEPRPQVTLPHWFLIILFLAWDGCISHLEHLRLARDCSAAAKPVEEKKP